MPEESTEIAGIVKTNPEPSKAMFAIEAASGLLETAKIGIVQKRYEDAYEDSRNAIRLASAAIMYNDGYVANTVNGAYDYMEQAHGKKSLVDEWKEVEIKSPQNKGIVQIILEFLRIRKSSEVNNETSARKALSVAETFVQSARSIVMMGGVPAWEITVMGK